MGMLVPRHDLDCWSAMQKCWVPLFKEDHFLHDLDFENIYIAWPCFFLLQGIQSGRITLAELLAEQQILINEITEAYRRRAEELPNMDESMQVEFRFSVNSLWWMFLKRPMEMFAILLVYFDFWLAWKKKHASV